MLFDSGLFKVFWSSYQIIAATGDNMKRLLLADWTLKVNEERAHGVIADVQDVAMTA